MRTRGGAVGYLSCVFALLIGASAAWADGLKHVTM